MPNTEKAYNGLEIYESDIEKYIDLYCDENSIENLKTDVKQNEWNAILIYVYRNTFKLNPSQLRLKENIYSGNLLHNSPSNCNAYDLDILHYIADIYIYLCYKYEKIIDIVGYSYLTGVPADTISSWKDMEPSSTRYRLYQKLWSANEETLLADTKLTSMARLNRWHDYNGAGTTNKPKNDSRSEQLIAEQWRAQQITQKPQPIGIESGE